MAGKAKKVRLPKPLKQVEWIGSSKKDLMSFPDEVQYDIGFALTIAQFGGKHGLDIQIFGIGQPQVRKHIATAFSKNRFLGNFRVCFASRPYIIRPVHKMGLS